MVRILRKEDPSRTRILHNEGVFAERDPSHTKDPLQKVILNVCKERITENISALT
jgi:hypothetical protein